MSTPALRDVFLFSELDEARAEVRAAARTEVRSAASTEPDEADEWGAVRQLLGGKGANLADMTALGIPVPPGFTVTTRACLRFQQGDGSLPDDLWAQETAAVRALEQRLGRGFGDPDAPLLFSCRSGGPVSMPGMMDTVLNLGMNDDVASAWIARGGDPRFVWDLYRRLVQMFGHVVLGIADEVFDRALDERRRPRGIADETAFGAEDWHALTDDFKQRVRARSGHDFPQDPLEQLRLATTAVFRSWQSQRARDYRAAAGISDDLGTAVNVQTMVYGNLGATSATGVCMSRNATTGEPEMEGDVLRDAQGEDVVAGVRQTLRLTDLREHMPDVWNELREIAGRLEAHYRDMQDIEFTVEEGRLWILQTRDGKRTAQAAVRIAVDLVNEGRIARDEALQRVRPEQVEVFLHPRFEPSVLAEAEAVATGLNVSPGAAVGRIALDADTAQRWAAEGQAVILVRPETKPDDVHGMLSAVGLLTSRGGRTSHAALVARQFGKPAVVGVEGLVLDLERRTLRFAGGLELAERDELSIDGTTGEVYAGSLATVVPDVQDPALRTLLAWADEVRTLGVRANADEADDARRARDYGAEGIGLCRTEHMFFGEDRLPIVRRMILAEHPSERDEAIRDLLPLQRADFEQLLRAMAGLPVIVRLLDPPLHEFLPSHDELARELADLSLRLQHAPTLSDLDALIDAMHEQRALLRRVEALREQNPMLGTRGVRLANLHPELTRMQVRAVLEAACACRRDGVDVRPEIMIPLTADAAEVRRQRELLEAEARDVMHACDLELTCPFGTMIEVPRAALTAGELATEAEFFSFGTNDLTQMTYGISRDDAEAGFLRHYLRERIFTNHPFRSLDRAGVGRLMALAVDDGRAARPGLAVGICGEHGGDPQSIALCHELGLDYVSCSPFRVPVARLAAAHAALG